MRLKLIRAALALTVFTLPISAFAQNTDRIAKRWILHFDEDEKEYIYGVSVRNVLDRDQSIKMSIVHEDAFSKPRGKALKLDYDVDSSRPAAVKFWFRLRDQDLSAYDTLHLSMRSEEGRRFSGNVVFQFTDQANREAPYLISGIQENWREFKVPLRRFKRIRDWSRIKEFEVIIDDRNAKPKEGSLLLDEIYVSRKDCK